MKLMDLACVAYSYFGSCCYLSIWWSPATVLIVKYFWLEVTTPQCSLYEDQCAHLVSCFIFYWRYSSSWLQICFAKPQFVLTDGYFVSLFISLIGFGWLLIDWLGFDVLFHLEHDIGLLLHSLAINQATWSSFSLICWSSDVLITFSTTWVLLLHFVAIGPFDIPCCASILSDWVLLMVKLCALIGLVDLLLPMVVKHWFVASSE
jgi:hypothetical protein